MQNSAFTKPPAVERKNVYESAERSLEAVLYSDRQSGALVNNTVGFTKFLS